MDKVHYLKHFFGARNDPKIVELTMEMRGQGLAIFWVLIEMIWENSGPYPYEPKRIAYTLPWTTPEEVERVIKDFGLFKNDGKVFWNEKALEGIRNRLTISEIRKNAGEIGGLTRAANVKQMLEDNEANALAINKEIINKEDKSSNKTRNFSIPPTQSDREIILEIFFFELNCKAPKKEVDRFIDYYAAQGWKFNGGSDIVDLSAAAKRWKPVAQRNERLIPFFRWYKTVYDCAKRMAGDVTAPPPASLIKNLWKVDREESGSIIITLKGETFCALVKHFVEDYNLGGEYRIRWEAI